MSVLFLDFDGVLNCGHDPIKGGVNGFDYCNPYSITALNMIITAANPEIVITSNWRTAHSLPELITKLKEWGVLNANVVGVTPELSFRPASNWTPSTQDNIVEANYLISAPRAQEIEEWLEKFPSSQFAIIDDSDIMSNSYWTVEDSELARRWIQTQYRIGLTPEAVSTVLQVLKS